jgi:hypothetical protein
VGLEAAIRVGKYRRAMLEHQSRILTPAMAFSSPPEGPGEYIWRAYIEGAVGITEMPPSFPRIWPGATALGRRKSSPSRHKQTLRCPQDFVICPLHAATIIAVKG